MKTRPTTPTDSQIIAEIDIRAYTDAAEIVSPNSQEFNDLYNKFYDAMIEEAVERELISAESVEAF